VAGSIERSASGKYSAVAAAVAAAHEELQLDLAAATLAEEEGADGLRSLSSHLPAWLWPFSRDAVRGVTTDELMRQIAAANDVGKLQQLCKGLLCERNDWRYKATQVRGAGAAAAGAVVAAAWATCCCHPLLGKAVAVLWQALLRSIQSFVYLLQQVAVLGGLSRGHLFIPASSLHSALGRPGGKLLGSCCCAARRVPPPWHYMDCWFQ
jgi:hypothetical protein